MSTIYPDKHVFDFEFIECENGDYRYRFSQRAVADPLTTRSTIILHKTGDTFRPHMLVAHHRPGNTKHGFRVDEDISLPIARHIVGNWVRLADHKTAVPFPEF